MVHNVLIRIVAEKEAVEAAATTKFAVAAAMNRSARLLRRKLNAHARFYVIYVYFVLYGRLMLLFGRDFSIFVVAVGFFCGKGLSYKNNQLLVVVALKQLATNLLCFTR